MMFFFQVEKTVLTQFAPPNHKGALLSEKVKSGHKAEKIVHIKAKETLELEFTKPKQNCNFDKPLIIPEQLFLWLTNLQV